MKKIKDMAIATTKLIFAQKFTLIFFILFPILMFHFLSYVEGNSRAENINLEKSKIYIEANGNEKGYEIYNNLFEEESLKKIFEKSTKDKSDFEIKLGNDFDINLEKGKETKIQIINNKNDISVNESILSNVLEESNKEISKNAILANAVKEGNIQQEEVESLHKDLEKILEEKIEINEIKKDDSISFEETMVAGTISTLILFVIFSMAPTNYFKDREESVLARKLSTSSSRLFVFLSYTIYVFIIGLIITSAFVAYTKIMGYAFKSASIPQLILMVLLYVTFVSLTSSILFAFTNKSLASTLGTLIFMVQGVIGGDLYGDKGWFILEKTMKNSPLTMLKNSIIEFQKSGNSIQMYKVLLICIVIGIVLFSIGYVVSKKTWREIK